MKLLITTTTRHAQLDESSGQIYELDVDRWEVVSGCPVPSPLFREYEQNRRGGMRGAKGIVVESDHVWIATASHVLVFDLQWTLLRQITHPSCAMIHDIYLHQDLLWVTSSENDLVIAFDRSGRVQSYFDFRTHRSILEAIGLPGLKPWDPESLTSGRVDYRDPRTHSRNVTDRVHLNSVCFDRQGNMWVSLGRVMPDHMMRWWHIKEILVRWKLWRLIQSANRTLSLLTGRKSARHSSLMMVPGRYSAYVLQVAPDGTCTIGFHWKDTMVPLHTLGLLRDGRMLYNNTDSGELMWLNGSTGELETSLFVDRQFLRGHCEAPDGRIYVGSQSHVYEVHAVRAGVTRRIRISDDERESVFALAILPPGMAPLPETMLVEIKQESCP